MYDKAILGIKEIKMVKKNRIPDFDYPENLISYLLQNRNYRTYRLKFSASGMVHIGNNVSFQEFSPATDKLGDNTYCLNVNDTEYAIGPTCVLERKNGVNEYVPLNRPIQEITFLYNAMKDLSGRIKCDKKCIRMYNWQLHDGPALAHIVSGAIIGFACFVLPVKCSNNNTPDNNGNAQKVQSLHPSYLTPQRVVAECTYGKKM